MTLPGPHRELWRASRGEDHRSPVPELLPQEEFSASSNKIQTFKLSDYYRTGLPTPPRVSATAFKRGLLPVLRRQLAHFCSGGSPHRQGCPIWSHRLCTAQLLKTNKRTNKTTCSHCNLCASLRCSHPPPYSRNFQVIVLQSPPWWI